MHEVGGAVVATTLVLLAVFVPTMVMPGLTGRLYRQFATTISVATVFSSVNALTLSPALCGLLLARPSEKKGEWRIFKPGSTAHVRRRTERLHGHRERVDPARSTGSA